MGMCLGGHDRGRVAQDGNIEPGFKDGRITRYCTTPYCEHSGGYCVGWVTAGPMMQLRCDKVICRPVVDCSNLHSCTASGKQNTARRAGD